MDKEGIPVSPLANAVQQRIAPLQCTAVTLQRGTAVRVVAFREHTHTGFLVGGWSV